MSAHTHKKHGKNTTTFLGRNVNIQEHRAPTDESVKLLNEMQEKALSNIIKSIRIDNNLLNGVVVHHFEEICMGEHKYTCLFSLNGVPFRVDLKVNPRSANSIEDMVSSFYTELSKKIAENIMKHVGSQLFEVIQYNSTKRL
jgi:hypothetical protein